MPTTTVSISSPRGQSRRLPVFALALVAAIGLGACGLERDGSHKTEGSRGAAAAGAPAELGRYRTEAVRLGVPRPLFLLIDTATGQVLQRNIAGGQKFRPVTEDSAPGADLEPKVPGRYDVKVVPGQRGSALLRVDTVTGQSWFAQLSSAQSQWYVIESSLDEEPPAAEALRSPGARPASQAAATGSPDQNPVRKPTLAATLEAISDPEVETALRVWIARQMAEFYPAEAAELLNTSLKSDDPKVMVAIIKGVELDTDGRVRAALESLRGHANTQVAEAVRKKLAP